MSLQINEIANRRQVSSKVLRLVSLTGALVCLSTPSVQAGPLTVGGSFNASSGNTVGAQSATGTNPTSQGAMTFYNGTVGSFFSQASPGNLSPTSKVASDTADWGAFGFSADAFATLSEQVLPNWAGSTLATQNPGATFVFNFSFSVSSAFSVVDTDTSTLTVGSTSAVYNYTVGTASGAGTRNFNPSASSQTGTWGTVSGSFALTAQQNFNISLSTAAGALVQKLTYLPWEDTKITSTSAANLTWLGVTGLHVYDASNQEISVPTDTHIQLIGSESGFDYWNSAAPSAGPGSVPDAWPTGVMLLASVGMLGFAAPRRRHN